MITGWTHPVSELLDVMDRSNVQAIVDLDGAWGRDIYENHWKSVLKKLHPTDSYYMPEWNGKSMPRWAREFP